jgi:endonuclease/exonuclease/phosphatase family metal-dependent hydrolase
MKRFFTLAFTLSVISVFAQDTIRVMHYNLMYYGQTTSYCTTTNNPEADKNGYLKTIIKYVKPDIFTANEVAPNATKHQTLMSNCLNVDGVTYYQKCNFSNVSSTDLSNELYYNTTKLGFVSQVNIPTSVRDINIYRLYYKSWNLSTTHDTAYITCIVMHLKAGTTATDISERATQTSTMMNYLNSVGVADNYVVMGDFNVYSSDEECYQNLINYSNTTLRFYDPINKPGDWNSNSSFATIHTQSTHTTSTGCFATGGMDDRFDHIMISDYIKTGSHHLQYFTNSYKTIGQDGNHYNQAINSGTNTSAPSTVIDALYGMSDHLPVTMNIRVDQTVGIKNYEEPTFLNVLFENPVEADMPVTIELSIKEQLNIYVLNLLGQTIYSTTTGNDGSSVNITLPTKDFDKGIYFLKISDSKNNCTIRKFVKE